MTSSHGSPAPGSIRVKVQRLEHAAGLDLPAYQTAEAAGADIVAALPADDPVTLASLERCAIPTGLALEIPHGHEVQIRPRSGLAFKHGLTILNAPGTIDSDYRGELKIMLVNLGTDPVRIERGDRIAQMVLAPVTRLSWEEAQTLSVSERGAGGFGSTGRS